jgi:uncharacterized oligopeptide transporter (OPT) family protein
MYSLKLLATPKEDFGKLIGLSVVCSFYGVFFAIPLRKFYILRQRLIFPDATITSIAIRTLHSSAETARLQLRALVGSFVSAFVWVVAASYAPGILQHWNIFYWISLFAGPGILPAHNWGWGVIETTPAFLGIGMIVGLNGSLSIYLGSIIAWAIIGPITVATGLTTGRPSSEFPNQVSYVASKYGSPRYWILWPGVLILLCAALAEVAVNYKPIAAGVKAGCMDLYNIIRRRPITQQDSEDPASPADQVPLWVVPLVLLT